MKLLSNIQLLHLRSNHYHYDRSHQIPCRQGQTRHCSPRAWPKLILLFPYATTTTTMIPILPIPASPRDLIATSLNSTPMDIGQTPSPQPLHPLRHRHQSQRSSSIKLIRIGRSYFLFLAPDSGRMRNSSRSLLTKPIACTVSTCTSVFPFGRCGVRERTV